jgi:hypothetical protein
VVIYDSNQLYLMVPIVRTIFVLLNHKMEFQKSHE